jgi:hypothetical protein
MALQLVTEGLGETKRFRNRPSAPPGAFPALGPATMKIRPEPGFNITQRAHVVQVML